jgi:Insertion element 4 transposase N-terminal/Transposase DDE domain
MARTKAALGAGARLSDYLSASLLARAFPSESVAACLDRHGRNSQRRRDFHATAGVYYCMALSLYPEASYESVFSVVSSGLAWSAGQPASATIAKSSISALRTKIGWQPLQELMDQHCLPMADPASHPEAFFAGLRIVAIDGSNFELPDEAANVEAFGYPGSRTGHAGYPQAQCAVLVECATHAIFGATIGAYGTEEFKLCKQLLPKLDASMLCLADRGFRGHSRWVAARASGAQLLWRTSTTQHLPVQMLLPDQSFLSQLAPSQGSRDERRAQAVQVRVIDYEMANAKGETAAYRLITSLTDHAAAPAHELARLYHERWEIEGVFDELKTHLLQSRRVLRSKTPDLVRQEFYGWVMAHYAVRWLLHQGASRHKLKHAEQSFIAHLNILKVNLPTSGAFSPGKAKKAQALV